MTIATAYYSRKPLDWLSREISAPRVTFIGRLNLQDPMEWQYGSIDPEALLAFAQSITKRGGQISILTSPTAHAKIYVGSRAVLVGSANLSMQGFGGGPEIVSLLPANVIDPALSALSVYTQGFQEVKLDQLAHFVAEHRSLAVQARRSPASQDRLPSTHPRRRVSSTGTYEDFLELASVQPFSEAPEIVARARGKGQLSGHIHRNFYGLRQFLLANPDLLARFSQEDPDTYKLSQDSDTEAQMAKFVVENATDEPDFNLEIWKTYLPRECGGRAGKHGGTIGNLNRMLPLVARYLMERFSRTA